MKPVVFALLCAFLLMALLQVPGVLGRRKSAGGANGARTSPWEDMYVKIPNRARAYEHLAYYTSSPHVAGTPEDYATAVFTQNKFTEYGLTSEIQAVPVLLTTPIDRSLQIVAPADKTFTAGLKEGAIPVDPTTSDPRVIPTFNGYAPSGDVTAEMVYANYATIEDFEYLQSQGISVDGKIVLARYGGIFRGVKAMIAQQYGAVGLVIYSDPKDDGYVQGKVYPDGPWRPETGVQRGSVQFLSICGGDPRRDVCVANKTDFNYTQLIPKIPVQPISWGDVTAPHPHPPDLLIRPQHNLPHTHALAQAQPFLQALGGPAAPANFQGGLPFTYHLGPGPITVRLMTNNKFFVSDIWNVIATIPADPSSPTKDEVVLMGNHRDAWVFGAVDPNSGTAVLLEMARGFGTLLRNGWKPQRTIVLASWDGEEYGLLGSTAYAESNAEWLSQNCVLYMNVDVGVISSDFNAAATPSLASFIRDATQSVIDPNTGKPLSDVWNQKVPVLGSGSDFTAYLDYLGIASLDMGFGGAYGVYHSVYDSQRWMNDWGNPTYTYYVALAQLWGIMGIRIADATSLPFNYTEYAGQLAVFLQQTYDLLAQHGGENKVDLSGVKSAVAAFSAAASMPTNVSLYMAERQFLGPGLPGRPWYRHVIQAPGLYLGYGADSFPGVKQAIRDENWDEAQQQADILAGQIKATAAYLASGSA